MGTSRTETAASSSHREAPRVVPVETPGLGDHSYLVHDGERAFVVDPQRDVRRVIDRAEAEDVQITHVLETHVHNDYVSGGLELARRTGAEIVSAAAEDLSFEHREVTGGDVISVGGTAVEVVHTPGHTHHHLTFVARAAGEACAAFTGGSLLFGTVGRTDLMGPDDAMDLTRAQHRSARSLLDSLPASCSVYPTHGFGSFCASGSGSDVDTSTIGRERRHNIAARVDDEETFVTELLASLSAVPAYYAHIPHVNRAGPQPLDLSPVRRVDAEELLERLSDGEWVVDLRSRRLFATDHVSGAVSFPLDDIFAVYVAWIVPWGSPITLIAEDPDDIAEAQLALARVGIDRPAGAGSSVAGVAPQHRTSIARRSFADLNTALADRTRIVSPVVVDVRRHDEWADEHIDGAVNVPLHELLDHMHHVPAGELWIHCASGYRATIAASLAERAGHDVVIIDDEWSRAAAAGLPILPGR